MSRIPLFPLELVLFPGAPLPLHLFEPRYKLMIGRCLERREEFGMILARNDGIAEVGCTAEILKVVKRYEDGRMDILTIGKTPFQVKAVHHDEPYFEGEVEFLEDDFSGISSETHDKLLQTYKRCYQLVHQQAAPTPESGPRAQLAYQIASFLPLDLDAKQALLELRNEGERQQLLHEKLEQWLPELERSSRVRRKAGGNGHAL